jgi:hypothetical protein
VRTLDGVLEWDFDVAIPGHGNDPLTKADVQAFRDRMNTIVERGRALVKKGTPKDQLIAQIQTDDLGWNIDNNQWNNPERLDLFYADLSK